MMTNRLEYNLCQKLLIRVSHTVPARIFLISAIKNLFLYLFLRSLQNWRAQKEIKIRVILGFVYHGFYYKSSIPDFLLIKKFSSMEIKQHSLVVYNSAEKVLLIEKVERSEEDEVTVSHLL